MVEQELGVGKRTECGEEEKVENSDYVQQVTEN